jgi:hypothetical protein
VLFFLDYCRSLLRDGRGAAFICRPSCGELLPFQECILEVTAYTDMWGEYSDHLVCKVSNDIVISLSTSM